MLCDAGLTVVHEEDGSFANLLDKEVSQIGGLIAVLGIKSVTNFQPGCCVEWGVTLSECVPLNRAKEDYLTAVAAAWRVVQLLDGCEHLWGDLTKEVFEDGVLQVSLTFKTNFFNH